MATYVLYFEDTGAPAAGLMPVFLTHTDLAGAAQASPAITEIAGGYYQFTLSPSSDRVVVIDGGAVLPAADRYLHALLTARDASPTLISKRAVPGGGELADLAGGNGLRQITVTVNDGDGDPLAGASVFVYGDGNETYFTSATTNAAGQVVFALNDGNYDVRLHRAGYSFTVPQNLTVSATAAVTYVGTSVVPDPPASPDLCRVYLYAVDLSGQPVENARVTVENLFQNPVQELTISTVKNDYLSDDAGLVEIDLVRGMRVRVSVGDTPISKVIDVPDAATASLAELLGQPRDSFTVIVGE